MNRAKIYIKSEISETDATISFNLPWYHGMASDFSNIRFFMSPYRIIPHWIESYTSDSAKVWIKLPSIHPGINIVFMEWGNWNSGRGDIEQTAYNGGGDDFEGNVDNWNYDCLNTTGVVLSFDFPEPSVLRILHDSDNEEPWETILFINKTFSATGTPLTIRIKHKLYDTTRSSYTGVYHIAIGIGDASLQSRDCTSASSMGWVRRSGYESAIYQGDLIYPPRIGGGSSTEGDIIDDPANNTWYICELDIKTGQYLVYRRYDTNYNLLETVTSSRYTGEYAENSKLYFGKDYSGYWYIDYLFVRKYLDPEPEVIDIQPLRINKYILYDIFRSRITVFPLIRELIPRQTNVYTKIQEICERSMKTYTQIREITERKEGIQTTVIESINYTTNIFTQVDELVKATLNSVDKLQYLKSSHNVIIYNNVFPFPAMKIDSATTNENVTIYTSLSAPEQKNYTVFTIPAGTEDTIIESDPISLTGSISVSFEGSLPSNATAYVSVNNTLYQMKNIGNYYYRTVRGITSSDTVKFIIKSTSADTDTKVFIRNIQIENTDEPTAYVSAGSSRDAGFLSYNFDPEKIKAIMLYVYTPESSNEKTILYMPASNIYLYVKGSKLYLNDSEILDWANDQWNLVYIDSNGVRVNTDSYNTTINFLSDTLYVAQKNGENHLNGFISMLTFLKKELSDPVKVMSSLIVR